MTGVEERWAPVVGGALRIRVQGPEAGDAMLLLHGGPGMSDRYLDGLVEELADTYRVATFAQRGVAPSTAGAPFDLGTQATDAVAVLDVLGWDRPLVLGHSFGGHLLLHVLAAHAERVRAAVALEALGGVGDGGAAAFSTEMMRRLPPSDRLRLEQPGLSAEDGLEIVWPAYFPPGGTAPAYEPIELFSDAQDEGWAGIEAGLPGLADRLRGLPVPVRFLVGDGSPVPRTAATDTAAAIGDAASVDEVDGGHFPWLVRPGVVRLAVDGFVAALR